MVRFFMVLFLSVCAASPLNAANEADSGAVPASFVAPLMQWVSARMSIPVTNLPIVYVSRERLIEKIGDPQRQAAQQAAIARALYVPGEVVMDDEFWDAGDARTVSFLVHELVHHAQLVGGRPYACNNAKEWEAYKLQNMWLAEHGLPSAVDERWIAHMSNCGVDYVYAR
ncbi:MAG: hypothetical protein EB059_03770 [Alphaproteobacteria bacterium]|nr:hypothetical protein [Alphaproteobacteria bacterium]